MLSVASTSSRVIDSTGKLTAAVEGLDIVICSNDVLACCGIGKSSIRCGLKRNGLQASETGGLQLERATLDFPVGDALGAHTELGGEGRTTQVEAGAELTDGGGASFLDRGRRLRSRLGNCRSAVRFQIDTENFAKSGGVQGAAAAGSLPGLPRMVAGSTMEMRRV